MQFQWTVGSSILLGSAAISLIIAGMAWRRRLAPGGTTLALLMLAVVEWSVVVALEQAAVGQPAKILWSKLEYVGMNSAIALLLMFALHYTRRDRWLTRSKIALMWMLPVLNVIMAATNAWHGLVWTDFSPSLAGRNLLIYHHGAWFFLMVASAYTYLLIAGVFLIRKAFRSSVLSRRQAGSVLLAMVVPWAANIIYVFELSPLPGLNMTPMGFAVSGLILVWSILGLRLFDLVPIARDTLVEHMSDGVLVLDTHNRIVDTNDAVAQLVGASAASIGQSADVVLSKWPEILTKFQDEVDCHVEVLLEPKPPCYVDVRISPLHDRSRRLTGRLVVFRDITKRYQVQTTLQQANLRLKEQVTRIEGLQANLRDQAIRDTLTGLLNRRYLEETLPRELAKAARERHSVAVIMLDIDHFEEINDSFGHKAGDLVLQALGRLLRTHTRGGDIASRYGGEEFVLVLPGLAIEAAHQRAEQLRTVFEGFRLEWAGSMLSVTLSAGIATYPDHGKAEEDLLRAADQAMYSAKAAGRNCVRVAE